MKTLYATVVETLDIFFFVYVHLRCIKPEKNKQNVDFAPPGKFSADPHGCSKKRRKNEEISKMRKSCSSPDVQRPLFSIVSQFGECMLAHIVDDSRTSEAFLFY